MSFNIKHLVFHLMPIAILLSASCSNENDNELVITDVETSITDTSSDTTNNEAEESDDQDATTTSEITVDLGQLFAVPSEFEINQVRDQWAQRDTTPKEWSVVTQTTHRDFVVDVIAHKINDNIHYGIVRHPKSILNDASGPVLIIHHGGTNGVSVNALSRYSNKPDFDDYTLILPSFPGEALMMADTGVEDLQSGGDVSEFDYDIDASLTMLNGVIENYAWVDPDNISVIGGSRGGCVSYLVAVRTAKIKRMVVYFGATDHLNYPELLTTIPSIMDNSLATSPFYNTILSVAERYLAGETSLEAARLSLLSKSALYFLSDLPAHLQIHHGVLDKAVPVGHSQILDAAITQANTMLSYQYFEYPEGGHGNNMPESNTRGELFILEGYLSGN